MKARIFMLSLLVVCPAVLARPQVVPHAPAAAPPAGFQAEFLTDLDDLQAKIVDLARSMPAEKYTWRPADGVRSISEVYMHIAGGNYFLATFLGVKPPADVPPDIEQISDKTRVLAELQRSFAFVRTLVKNTSQSDLDKSVTMYGKATTERAVLNGMLNHMHEHLGQSIAYARMNGVVPPWSR